MNRKSIAAIAVLALAIAAPQVAFAKSDASATHQATVAKKKHKKKRHKKKRPVPVASPTPTTPTTPETTDPVDPPDPPSCAGEDSAEPDDTFGSATVLPFTGDRTWIDRYSCPDDLDFFKVTLPPDGFFDIDVAAGSGFDLTVTSYDENGSQLGTANNTGAGGSEHVEFDNSAMPSTTRWISVTGVPSTSGGSYSVQGFET